MSFPIELNGEPVSQARIDFPAFGVGRFRVTLPTARGISAQPGALSLKYSGLTITGSLLATYELGAGVEAECVFGFRGWAQHMLPKSYQSESGVRLSTILTDLERETGERFDSKPDTILGVHWNRPGAVASRVLTQAAVGWRTKPDGITTIAPLPATTAKGEFAILSMDESRGVYHIAADDISQFVPGASFSNSVSVAPQRCGAVTHVLGDSALAICYAIKS